MNAIAILIVISLFLLWNLEFIATLLNIKTFPSTPPPELEGLMDQEKLDQARSYLATNSRFDLIRASFSLAVLLGFWFIGGFAYTDTLARSLADNEILAGLIFLSALFLAQNLISLPFDYYETFVIEQKFGFNKSTPALFFTDRIKGLLLAAVLGLPLLAGILWIFHEVPNAWLWAWAFVTAFQLILTYLAPSLILPLFNKFTPMEDGELKTDIEALGDKCGFPLHGVFTIDGSKRSTKANAYFTGFGKHKKIALFDTLIEKSSNPEILAILAHEIGHFRLGHIKQRLFVGILQMALIFFLIGLATDPNGAFAKMLHEAFFVTEISPHVGLVLFTILLEPASKLLSVLANAWSRKHEFEADAYASQSTGTPEALATALKKLSSDHLSHPAPHSLRIALDYSHPPLLQRLKALLP
ncbi:MAG: M48 family metallopeptidase [Akkermansiaceae bacterium]|jgi:STE24 endopeptidase|nr:M48 family metallopeptidase [Akkermansiaceae bacterium]MDP4722179.1 M48 family metallopeptidase [Akkermansiaceae bacterium]MDP4780851.1 M48 family metallopeptidase [Akkermansiaceae bacterium]MDP4848425.1 M48 family metallopeptidase [Akkermansiaceae bacterium]MDP4896821.1 M48 family metallopeptidase [Akkermansiaceae bacterium]